MRSQKDLKKWKAILLAIDLVMLAVAVAAGLYAVNWILAAENAPNAEYEASMQQIVDQEQLLDTQIAEARLASENRLETAKETLEAARVELAAEREKYNEAYAEYTALEGQVAECQAAIDGMVDLPERINALRREYAQKIRQLEDMILAGESDYRICYLTFDDGPSYYTERFLDELDRLDINVTFFTIGIQMGTGNYATNYRDELLRREAASGHSIANHTYTHSINYSSYGNFTAAVDRQDDVVYNATGFHTEIVRFPAGSYYCPFRTSAINYLDENGYGWIDWSANAYDSGNNNYSAATTADKVIWQVRQEKISVVLMHDWKLQTLGALDEIVTTLQEENYVFLPLFKDSTTVGTVYPKWD